MPAIPFPGPPCLALTSRSAPAAPCHSAPRPSLPSPACRAVSGLPDDAPWADVLASAPVRDRFQAVINELARQATGSANRIARALLLAEPPSIDKGEVTDKGSINQRAVLKHRDALVQALHDDTAAGILKPQA